jgi:DNA-binding transcriptional regulator YbjK
MPVGERGVQERGKASREALLKAAVELLAEGGAKAVTHRAVAGRADVPLAATTYYFKSISDLTDQALQWHVDERIAELQQLTAEAASKGTSAEEVARAFADSVINRPWSVILAQYEVYLEAARNPVVRPSVARALAAFEDLACEALALLGSRRPESGARAFVALIDGFMLHRLANPGDPAEDAEALFEAMRALFISQVMDDDVLEGWHSRLAQPPAHRP